MMPTEKNFEMLPETLSQLLSDAFIDYDASSWQITTGDRGAPSGAAP